MSSSSDNAAAGNGAGSAGSKPSLELPLATLPSTHPCSSCGACCRYIAVEIDSPTAYQDYDHIYWYLTHRGVAVYLDWEGDWYLEFETVCEHLTHDATCGIYRDRPQICSDFSWESCERSTGEEAYKVRFERPEQFMGWLEERRPKAYARYAARRDKLLAKRERESAALSAQVAAGDPPTPPRRAIRDAP